MLKKAEKIKNIFWHNHSKLYYIKNKAYLSYNSMKVLPKTVKVASANHNSLESKQIKPWLIFIKLF